MNKETKDKHFIKRPIYEGGPKAMKEFIKNNLQYPKAALENKIEGTVSIDYKIDHKGKVIDAKVISGLGHGCDEEAIRLVELLKFTVPKNRKIRVTFNKKIQIHFRLPKEKPKKKVHIQYNYSKAPKTEKKEEPKKKGSYTITINY